MLEKLEIMPTDANNDTDEQTQLIVDKINDLIDYVNKIKATP